MRYAISLFVALGLFSSQLIRAEDVTIQTENGPLEAETSKVPKNFTQYVRELTTEELVWLRQTRSKADKFISGYVKLPSDSKNLLLPKNMDLALKAWRDDSNLGKTEEKDVILMLGVAFGTYVTEKQNVEWKVVTDMYGTDLSLIFKGTQKQIYPISSVGKRVTRGEYDFFVPLYDFVNDIGNKR